MAFAGQPDTLAILVLTARHLHVATPEEKLARPAKPNVPAKRVTR